MPESEVKPTPMPPLLRKEIEASLLTRQFSGEGHYEVCFGCGVPTWIMTKTDQPIGVVVDGWLDPHSMPCCTYCQKFEYLHPEIFAYVSRVLGFLHVKTEYAKVAA